MRPDRSLQNFKPANPVRLDTGEANIRSQLRPNIKS